MVCSKMIEIATECIPGCVLQIAAYIQGGHSRAAALSIVISALTTAYISASISYDLDTDPKKREGNPKFYGLVPNSSTRRAAVFVVLIFVSFFYTLLKAFALALIMMVNITYGLFYTLADLAIFFLYKVISSDYEYQVRIPGIPSVFTTFVVRFVFKLATDYTCCVHFRSPTDLGGLYWTISMIVGACTAGEEAVVRSERLEEGSDEDRERCKERSDEAL